MRFSYNSKPCQLAACTSLADLLVGIHLALLYGSDASYKEIFPMVKHKWNSSVLCRIMKASFLTSIQLSLFFLLFIATNHYFAIVRALKKQKISQRTNLIMLSVLFSVAVGIAAVFGIYQSNNSEYLCVPFGSGLVDTIIFAVSGVIDMFVMVVVAFLYTSTLHVVNESAKKVSKKNKNTAKLTRKIILLLLTNMITTISYISVGLSVILGIGREIYTWIVVFGITCNACLNPMWHTFSTSKFLYLLKSKHI